MPSTPFVDASSRPVLQMLGDRPSVLNWLENDARRTAVRTDANTDDLATLIQDAIDSVAAKGGGELFFPAGTYLTTDISVPAGVVLVGDNRTTIFKRHSSLPAQTGLINLAGVGAGVRNISIDGDVTTTTTITGNEGTFDPDGDTLTADTSIWVQPGANDFVIEGCYVTHTGGYAVFVDVRTGSTRGGKIIGNTFENNRPHLWKYDSGDTAYGSWTGGVFIKGICSGASPYAASGIVIAGNSFRRQTGNCIWMHSDAFDVKHSDITITGNTGEYVARDFTMVGNVQNVAVVGNSVSYIGYVHTTDIDSPAAAYSTSSGIYGVAYDNAGYVTGTQTGNSAKNVYGGGMDLDGVRDSVIASNYISCNSSFGKGIQTGDSNANGGATNVVIEGNFLEGCLYGAIVLANASDCTVRGNRIEHSNYATQPILIYAGSTVPSGNVVTQNRITYTLGGAYCVIESGSGWGSSHINYVGGNIIDGGHAGEFSPDASSASKAGIPMFANASNAALLAREGTGTASSVKIYITEAGARNQYFQLQSDNALLNISEGGTAQTGILATGTRTTLGYGDALFTGKVMGDAFFAAYDYAGASTSYQASDANALTNDWALLRFNKTSAKWETSLTTSAGARVWTDLIPSEISGLTAGRVVFAASATTLADDALFTWNDTDKILEAPRLWVVGNQAAQITTVIRGASAQTNNLTEWHNSSGHALAVIGPDGKFTTRDIDSSTGATASFYYKGGYSAAVIDKPLLLLSGTATALTVKQDPSTYAGIVSGAIQANSTASNAIEVIGAGGGMVADAFTSRVAYYLTKFATATMAAPGSGYGGLSYKAGKIFWYYDDSGTPQWREVDFGSVGSGVSGLTAGRVPFAASATSLDDDALFTWNDTDKILEVPRFWVVGNQAAQITTVIKGAAAQTNNLTEWHNSSGHSLAVIGPDGKLTLRDIDSSTGSTVSFYYDGTYTSAVINQPLLLSAGTLRLPATNSPSAWFSSVSYAVGGNDLLRTGYNLSSTVYAPSDNTEPQAYLGFESNYLLGGTTPVAEIYLRYAGIGNTGGSQNQATGYVEALYSSFDRATNDIIRTSLYGETITFGSTDQTITGLSVDNSTGNVTINGALIASGSNPMTFTTGAVERCRWSAGGNFLMGTTTDDGTHRLQLVGGWLSVSTSGGSVVRIADSHPSTGGSVRIAQIGETTFFYTYDESAVFTGTPLQLTASNIAGSTLTLSSAATNALLLSSGSVTAVGLIASGSAYNSIQATAGGLYVGLGVTLDQALYPKTLASTPNNPSGGYGGISHKATSTYRFWNGSAWFDVDLATAAGVTSVNTLSGALTLAGTSNQVTITPSGSTLTFSTPQNLHSGATPTFDGLVITAGTPAYNNLQLTNGGAYAVLGLTTDQALYPKTLASNPNDPASGYGGFSHKSGATYRYWNGSAWADINMSTAGGGVSQLNTLTGSVTLAGTSNQITLTPSGNTITFSTPQNLHTAAAPTFGGLAVRGNTTIGGVASTDYRLFTESGNGTIRAQLFAYDGLGGYVGTNTNHAFFVRVNDGNVCGWATTGVLTQYYAADFDSTLNVDGAVTCGSTVVATGAMQSNSTAYNAIQAVQANTSGIRTYKFTAEMALYLLKYASATMAAPSSGYGGFAYKAGKVFYYYDDSGTPQWREVDFSTVGGGVTSLTASTGISVSASTGAVTITNTGVTSLTGTSNQVTVSASTGAVTLSLPTTVSTTSFSATGTSTTLTFANSNNNFYVNGNGDVTIAGQVSIAGAVLSLTGNTAYINLSGSTPSYYMKSTKVINDAAQFVGPGIACGSYGIGGGAFNPWNGSGYDTGQTWTLALSGATFSINGSGTYSSIVFKGGVIVNAS